MDIYYDDCMKLCLNTRTIDSSSLEDKIESTAKAGFEGIEIWLDDCLGHKPSCIKRIVEDAGLVVPTAIKIAGWFEGDGRQMEVSDDPVAIMDECKRRLELASEIGAQHLIAIPSRDDRGYFVETEEAAHKFMELCEMGFSCVPTIEFMGQTSQINTIDSCLGFLSHGEGLTMVLDAYHVWRGGDTFESMRKVKVDQVSALHLSDANREILRLDHRDRDRVMPGDGQIDLGSFFAEARLMGFEGFVSVGVYNPVNWSRNPFEVAQEAFDKSQSLMLL